MSIRTGFTLLLALAAVMTTASTAHAESASFTYEFTAKQNQLWSSVHPVGDCFFPASAGTGTTESVFTAKGNVEVTGKVKRPSFTMTPKSRNSKVRFTELGRFELKHSTDPCYSTPVDHVFDRDVKGRQFFKGRTVVLKDERSQEYNQLAKLGLKGRTDVQWRLEMTPRDD